MRSSRFSKPPKLASFTLTGQRRESSKAWRLENPGAYALAPSRTLGSNGQIRPWTTPGSVTHADANPEDSQPSSGAPHKEDVPEVLPEPNLGPGLRD
jgi:hypothetical protein